MSVYLEIQSVHAREILDSRGNPTVEAEVFVKHSGEGRLYSGRAAVPSGASTGKFEAVELRDGEKRYLGLGVQRAVKNVNEKIAPLLIGRNVLEQRAIDRALLELDGTENKENLGANAILGISMAVAQTAAKALHLPLYQYLGGTFAHQMPVPMMNILNGGRHASNTVDLQEFMIMPFGAENFSKGLQMCAEIYHTLKKILDVRGLSTGVGDEGGFAPNLKNSEEVLDIIVEAVEKSGYQMKKDIMIALDVAASELYDEKQGIYRFEGEGKERTTEEMIIYYKKLTEKYPIFSIEDGLFEDDWVGWKHLTEELGEKVQLVGDDLFVTNIKRLKCGIRLQTANAILIKMNQIGTLSEAMDAVEMAQKAGYRAVVSHRSGETEDSFIADLAVAVGAGQIKTGAPCRSDRTSKYNQLLRICDTLENTAVYENPFMGETENYQKEN